MKTNKIKLRLGCIFLSAVMAFGFFGAVTASGDTLTGSFEIYCHGTTDDGVKVELSGAEIGLYKVGDYVDGSWKLNQEFLPSGADLEDMSASAQREAANVLYRYAVDENISGTSGTTADNGRLVFGGIELGLYLVAMKDEYRYGDGYFRSAPFLLTMPINTGEGIEYDFTAEPKTEWVPDFEEPTTDDNTNPTETEEPTEPTEPTETTEPGSQATDPTSPTTKPTSPTKPSTSPSTRPTSSGGDSQQTGDNRNTEYLALLGIVLSVAAIVILRRRNTEV